ncbi:HET-domain-containing protein [Paraphaeosphaeria sporulosa]|uniref:HET-domain-containing protein n=1 Tax=Paraphaeosphaeria sporulosa TaxID=1460663 RepID=A0A177C299_9PLEO|nr:HET-domain-containing protein [Paraphaeosphaeria sporulosa]OAG00938.1 HET-domain-containing protein [Paraphaeosphaeria sporulosa]
MAISNPLCPTCERAFAANDDTTSHHTAAEELQRSVEKGCFICKRLYNKIQELRNAHATGESIDRPLFDEIRYTRQWSGNDWSARNFTVEAFGSYSEIWFDCISKEVAKQLGLRTSLYPSLRSPNSLKQAKVWLEDCRQHHELCNRRLQSTFVPTRLVHVRQLENGSVTSACLVIDTSLPARTPYLSLSHCWGGAKFLTLTGANLGQLREAIPVAELTAVFQDALYVAFQLGIPYVWIDSLCIIQDSPADWEYESKRMGEVYKGAVCNLSASAFKTGKQGLSSERGSHLSGFLPLQIDTQNGSFSTSAACPEDAQFYVAEGSVLRGKPWEEICNGPLFERAWVLQEQILALRVLHFGKREMFWECRQVFANETRASGWASLPTQWHGEDAHVENALGSMGDAFRYHKQRNPLWQFMVEDLESVESSDGLWRRIVRDYSARSLTYAKDRLPALSGVATEFSAMYGRSQYLLGQWSDDLHLGLLWSQKRPFPSSAHALAWPEVPSWSWASLNAPVDWYLYDLTVDSQQDPTSLCKSINPMTEPDSHAMTLIGNLMRLDVPDQNGGPRWFTFDNGSLTLAYWTFFSWQFYLDQWYFDSLQGKDDEMKTHAMLSSVFFIPLLYKNYRQIICLVLLPLPSVGRGIFRRAGILHIYNPAGGVNKNFTPTAREYQKNITENFYQDCDGEGNYKISII